MAETATKPDTRETRRQRCARLVESLRDERTSWLTHWRELSDYILPRRLRYLSTDRNRGDKRNQRILDSTATRSARVLASGMMGGMTSPARPWFGLTTPDRDLAEWAPVKEWLGDVTVRMAAQFHATNFYNAMPLAYLDLGVFSTHASIALDDAQDVLRFYPLPVGGYMLASDQRGVVDTLVREYSMTVRQLVAEFGLDNVSDSTKVAWQRGSYEQWIEVVHVIRPNPDADPRKLASKHKPWTSCYFEAGSDGEQFLRETGFDNFPALCPRWDVLGEDVYGTGPGMDALGDCKQLQLMESKSLKALDKMIDPPLVGPTTLRTTMVNMLPGGITLVDEREGFTGLRPLHQVNYQLDAVEAKAEAVRNRIRGVFHEDLFLMLSLDNRRQPATAREIAERHEEKLIVLGPVLERLNDELLGPAVDRMFNAMLKRGLLPRPPEELQGQALKIEYTSILAQAQKMVATGAVERFMGFAGNLAAANPDVLDKVDMDQALDEYGQMLGVPPRIVRPDEQVAAIRQQRAAAVQAQQQAAMAQQAAQGAKTLSETDLKRDSALTRLLGGGA